jgi:branched-chain amino acid transport system permease protein
VANVLRAFGNQRVSSFLALIVAIGLLLLPAVTQDPYLLHILILSFLFGSLATSWNLLVGYTGIFTFGHQAFFGIGAYTSALLAVNAGVSPWIGMWIGGIGAAFTGALIALPALRIKSVPHVAIVTLAFAEIVRITASNLTGLTRGELGLAVPGMSTLNLPFFGSIGFTAATKLSYYYLALIALILIVLFIRWLVHSPTGLALKAMRDSQDAAESLGVNLTLYKLLAFALSSFLGGVIGALYAHYVLILTPISAIGIELMIQIVAMTLVGGVGTLYGPALGAFLLTLGLESLRALGDYRLMIYGLLLVLLIIFLPKGLASLRVPGFPRTESKDSTPSSEGGIPSE